MRTVIIAYISIGSQIFENRSHITYPMILISVEVRIYCVEKCHENGLGGYQNWLHIPGGSLRYINLVLKNQRMGVWYITMVLWTCGSLEPNGKVSPTGTSIHLCSWPQIESRYSKKNQLKGYNLFCLLVLVFIFNFLLIPNKYPTKLLKFIPWYPKRLFSFPPWYPTNTQKNLFSFFLLQRIPKNKEAGHFSKHFALLRRTESTR
jgi:hypothetical protein